MSSRTLGSGGTLSRRSSLGGRSAKLGDSFAPDTPMNERSVYVEIATAIEEADLTRSAKFTLGGSDPLGSAVPDVPKFVAPSDPITVADGGGDAGVGDSGTGEGEGGGTGDGPGGAAGDI